MPPITRASHDDVRACATSLRVAVLLAALVSPAQAGQAGQAGRTLGPGDRAQVRTGTSLHARCDKGSPVRETLRADEVVIIETFIESWVAVRVEASGEQGCLPRAALGLAPAPPRRAAPLDPDPGAPRGGARRVPGDRRRDPASGRARASVNVGWQLVSDSFEDVRSFPLNAETARVTSAYEVNGNVTLDIGAHAIGWRGLTAGVAVTRFTDSRDVAIDATLPHPFLFERNRSASGVAAGEREETAVHASVGWLAPVGNRLELMIFGGPTFFRVKQSVVTDIDYTDTFPFDEVSFTGATIERESESKVGYHAGIDVGYYVTRNVGVGGIVRYTRANVTFSLGDREVGGIIAGGGVRLKF